MARDTILFAKDGQKHWLSSTVSRISVGQFLVEQIVSAATSENTGNFSFLRESFWGWKELSAPQKAKKSVSGRANTSLLPPRRKKLGVKNFFPEKKFSAVKHDPRQA